MPHTDIHIRPTNSVAWNQATRYYIADVSENLNLQFAQIELTEPINGEIAGGMEKRLAFLTVIKTFMDGQWGGVAGYSSVLDADNLDLFIMLNGADRDPDFQVLIETYVVNKPAVALVLVPNK